jgi:hypothetical protein
LFDLGELFAASVQIEKSVSRGHGLSDGSTDGEDPPADYRVDWMVLAMNL